jgi:hypothetical protein
MEHYARIIQELQDDIGLQADSFHDIGNSALSFYSLRAWQIIIVIIIVTSIVTIITIIM